MQWENHVIYRDNYVRGMIKNRPRAFLLRLSEAELTLFVCERPWQYVKCPCCPLAIRSGYSALSAIFCRRKI